MPANPRAARRRRMLETSKDRLAFITGHAHNLPSTSSQSLHPNNPSTSGINAQSPPLISRIRDPNVRLSGHPTATDLYAQWRFTIMWKQEYKATDEGAEHNQNDGFDGGRSRGKLGVAVQRKPPSVSGAEKLSAILLNPLRSITSRQLRFALEATEQPRMAFSITMALVMLMSYSGFPIFGSKIIKSILLFQPLLFLLFSNSAIVVLRLLSDLERGKKYGKMVTVSGGCGWAEEAVRVLEVGLMLHDVLQALFMDLIVYSLLIICGFCLFS